MLIVNQTDFVSKNPDFLDFSKQVASLVVKSNPADVPALNSLAMGDKTVEGTRYLTTAPHTI